MSSFQTFNQLEQDSDRNEDEEMKDDDILILLIDIWKTDSLCSSLVQRFIIRKYECSRRLGFSEKKPRKFTKILKNIEFWFLYCQDSYLRIDDHCQYLKKAWEWYIYGKQIDSQHRQLFSKLMQNCKKLLQTSQQIKV